MLNQHVFKQVFSPKFSPDGSTVYFLIPFGGTTQAIARVDLTDRMPRFVTAALSFEVVLSGQYKGDLIALIRKSKLAPGYYEWYWLLEPSGKEIGLVGDSERDVQLFLESQE